MDRTRAASPKSALSFGPFVLDSNDLLHANDRKIHLCPKQTEALRYLAGNSGRIVAKDELLSRVWQGIFVGDGSLHQCISALRKQLGNAAKGLEVIETVAKRGYRFLLPVHNVDSQSEPKVADTDVLRIGILRFESKGGGDDLTELADASACRLAARMSRLHILGIEVINQAALDRLSASPLDAARRLGLSLLVVGRVLKERGASVVAEVEIVRRSDQTLLWAGAAKADSLEELDARLAGLLVEQLPLPQTGIDKSEVVAAVRGSEECLDLYLRGLAYLRAPFSHSLGGRSDQDLRLAIQSFRQATDRDPKDLASRIGLSNTVLLACGRGLISPEETARLALLASEAALIIDPRSLSARAARATVDWTFEGMEDRGERELRGILEENPCHFAATQFLAIGLIREGRLSEAINVLETYLGYRPDTPDLRSWLTYGLFLARRFESALREAKKCVVRFPDWDVAWAQLCFIAAYCADYRTALEAGDIVSNMTNNGPLLAMYAYGLAQSGEKQRAEELIDYILAFHREYVIHSAVGPALVALGKQHKAISSLEQAHQEHDIWVSVALMDPRLDPIRSSTQFLRVQLAYKHLSVYREDHLRIPLVARSANG